MIYNFIYIKGNFNLAINPGSARVRYLTIANQPFDPNRIWEIIITESLMRSFQTLEMVLVDNVNIINTMEGGLKGGEDIRLVFDDGQSGVIYEFVGKLHSIGGGNTIPNGRASIYKIIAMGLPYYGNKVGGKVQMSFKNVTGSEAIKRIHDEYLRADDADFEVDTSKGFLGEEEPFLISNLSPFQAIHMIRTRLTSDKFDTGCFCYYRDKDGYKLRQLEKMFAELEPQEFFLQDATMGKSISDYSNQGRNIIGFQSGTSFSGEGGKGSPLATYGVDKKVQTNYINFGEGYNKGPIKDPSPGKMTGDGSKGLTYDTGDTHYARQYKLFPGDPRLNKIDYVQEKSNDEQLYANLIRGGPCFTAKVPLDGGLRCTVGKGIYAELAAPVGSDSSTSENQTKGNYLIVNLKHHLRLNNTQMPMATTTFEAVRGGLD